MNKINHQILCILLNYIYIILAIYRHPLIHVPHQPNPHQLLEFQFVMPRAASVTDTEVSAPLLVQRLATNTIWC